MQCAPRLTWRPAQIKALTSGPPTDCRSRTWRGTRPEHPWGDSQVLLPPPRRGRGSPARRHSSLSPPPLLPTPPGAEGITGRRRRRRQCLRGAGSSALLRASLGLPRSPEFSAEGAAAGWPASPGVVPVGAGERRLLFPPPALCGEKGKSERKGPLRTLPGGREGGREAGGGGGCPGRG